MIRILLIVLAMPANAQTFQDGLIQLREVLKNPCQYSSSMDYAVARNKALIQLHVIRLNSDIEAIQKEVVPTSEKSAWMSEAKQIRINDKKSLIARLQRIDLHEGLITEPSIFKILEGDTESTDGAWDCKNVPIDNVYRVIVADNNLKQGQKMWQEGTLSDISNAFFAALEIQADLPLHESQDLSVQFAKPQLQGHDGTCVPMGVLSDLGTFLNTPTQENARGLMNASLALERKLLHSPDFNELAGSPGKVTDENSYPVLSREAHSNDYSTLLKDYKEPGAMGIYSVASPLVLLGSTPLETLAGKIRVEKFVGLKLIQVFAGDPEIWRRANMVRAALDKDVPLIVMFATDVRERPLEDWIIPDNTGKHIGHVLNVIGYGKSISPLTLKPEPYFLVRDSFVEKPVHYRMPAEMFVENMLGLFKITKIKNEANGATK